MDRGVGIGNSRLCGGMGCGREDLFFGCNVGGANGVSVLDVLVEAVGLGTAGESIAFGRGTAGECMVEWRWGDSWALA